jgi:hypothetical protein
MVAAVVKDNLEMIRFPDIHAKVSASDCCSFEGLLFHSYQACSFCEGDEFFHLVQVMESVLRFAFSKHLNNVKAEEYWGPDARGLMLEDYRTCKTDSFPRPPHRREDSERKGEFLPAR